MQVNLLLQTIFIFVIFIINLVFVLLPLKIIPRDPNRLSGSKSKRIISFCNCFSGGVFLAVCFLQLTPYINAKLEKVFVRTESHLEFCLPTTQCLIIAGFFLTQFVEQAVRHVQKPSQVSESEQHPQPARQVPTVKQLPKWLPSSSSDLGSESSDLDDMNSSPEKARMLRPKRKRRKPKNTGMTENKAAVNVSPETVVFKAQEEAVDLGHGHSHLPTIHSDDIGLRCVLLLLALSLHSFFEGIAIGLQDQTAKLVNLFLGVAVHECLVAFAVGISLAQQQLKFCTVLKLSIFFSCTIPVGIGIGMVIGTVHDSLGGQITSAVVQGIAAGTFYHVIFLEILPSELHATRDGLLRVLFIFIGFAVITVLSFSIGHEHR